MNEAGCTVADSNADLAGGLAGDKSGCIGVERVGNVNDAPSGIDGGCCAWKPWPPYT